MVTTVNAAFVDTYPHAYVKIAAMVVKIAMVLTAPKEMARTPLPSRPTADAALMIATRSNANEGRIPISSALTPRKTRAIRF